MSENLLEETKQIVKSLVIPHPRGVGLRFLCDEYQEMEGKQLPYRELGYKSLTHFLNSIPDVVKMYGHLEDPGSVTLFPVADESTAHIVEMVAHQSKNKRGKKKSPRNAFPFRTNPRPRITYATQSTYNPNPYYSQRITNSRSTTNPKSLSSSWNAVRANYLNKSANKTNSNVFNFRSNESNTWQNFTVRDIDNPNVMAASHNKSVKSNSNPNLNVISRPTAQHSSGHEVLRSSQSPFVTTQVKENLMKMMTSRDMDDGIMLFNFDARYKHQFNESLDWKKFGFSSLVECLKSVPQLINLIPTGTNTFKLMPSKFVNHEPTFTKHSSQLPTTTTVLTNGHSMAVITTTATSTTVTFVTTSLNTMTTTSITTQNSATHNNMRPICSPSPSHSSGVSSEPSTRSNSPTSHIDLNKKAIENFRHILCLFDKGIPATQFPHEYEKVFKVRFDSRIWGFPTPMELFHRLPEIFAIQEKDDTSDPLLHDSRFKKFERPKHVPKMNPTDLCYLSKIPDLVQSRIMKLIDLNMPSGLPLPYFCEEYKMNYGEIDLSQMRITDTSHLFNVLQSGLPIIVKMVDGNNRAFLKSEKDVDNWIGECTRTYRYIVPKTMVNVPPNVVLPGDQMRPITLPKGVEVGNGEYVAVYISSAVSPSDIYIQFRGPDYHTALEEQMKKLDIYECLDEDVWRVPKQFLCLGLPVVARFQGDRYWNRARVIKIHDETRESRVVTVSFVDYGGILVTDYKDLRLMKREFLGLPMQALRVSLYGIKPILGAEGWTAAARDKVLRFSKRNYGIACTFMEEKNGVYMVCLCDTNSSSDIFIHNVLVNDGHALFEENVLDLLADEVNGQNTIDSTNNFGSDEYENRVEQSLSDNQIKSSAQKALNINMTQNKIISDNSWKHLSNIYLIKWINWKGIKKPIITQNTNGACPLIAIFNVLVLSFRLNLNINKQNITGEELISCLSQHIVNSAQNSGKKKRDLLIHVIDHCILYRFLNGIHVNIHFNGITEFESTLEVKVFDLLDISLYHGWVVDPQNHSLITYIANASYDQLIERIIIDKSSQDIKIVSEALNAEHFLQLNSMQLTVYGLFQLQTDLSNEEICVLFRNNHFITLYKHENALYQLVTDQGFINENTIVWETLNHVDGNDVFVDENFVTHRNDSIQQQWDYEFARSLDKQLNPNKGWNKDNWDSKPQNSNWNNGTNHWAEDLNQKPINRSIDLSLELPQNCNNQHKEQFAINDGDSDSNKQNQYQLKDVNVFKVAKVQRTQRMKALDSTIDVTDNLSQLPAPLTPSRATTITPKQDANLVPNEVSNKVQIQSNSLLQSIPQIEESDDRNETPCHESKSVNNSFMSQSLSIEQLREVAQKVISEESKTASRTKKLTPKITISSNVHKGETLITNENGISARNLSKLSQLELTPNNSGSDTESVGDLKEKKLPNYSKEDILEAKAKIISVKNKYVHLIYYKQEFYFTYEGVHEIFNGTELWQLIGFSGGYIKGRIQLIEEEGIALFSHLDVKYRTDKRLIFLYPEESVVEFTSLSGDTEVRVAIKKSVKQFAEDIAKAETAKLQRVMSSLNRKVKNIKV